MTVSFQPGLFYFKFLVKGVTVPKLFSVHATAAQWNTDRMNHAFFAFRQGALLSHLLFSAFVASAVKVRQ